MLNQSPIRDRSGNSFAATAVCQLFVSHFSVVVFVVFSSQFSPKTHTHTHTIFHVLVCVDQNGKQIKISFLSLCPANSNYTRLLRCIGYCLSKIWLCRCELPNVFISFPLPSLNSFAFVLMLRCCFCFCFPCLSNWFWFRCFTYKLELSYRAERVPWSVA